MYRIKTFWLLCLFFGQSSHSKELLLVAGLEKPPYVIPANNSGFEIELMREVLSILEHEITVVYVPYGRTYEIMRQIKADSGLTLIAKSGAKNEMLTMPYVVYRNVAISQKKSAVNITKISDLNKHSLVAFQSARKVLGNEFANASEASPLYFELPDQKRQVELLLSDKVEVIVMDINIFKYFAKSIGGPTQISKVDIHSIFPSTYYRAAITSPSLRDSFNQAFAKYIQSDQYTQLLEKYDMSYLLKTDSFSNAR